jgi:hypothetical protein
MSEPHDDPPESAPRPRRRWGCILVCLLVVGTVVGLLLFLGARGDRALQQAVAEADAQDPGWRLPQLEEKREQARPPDKDNSALQVQAARRLMPAGWGSAPGYYELFQDVPPEAQYNALQIAALQDELQKGTKAREEARKLADMPDGHATIAFTPDWISTLLPNVQDTRQVAMLLQQDAFLRAQEKDPDGAVRSLQAAVNAGRSLHDTPMAISQLVQIACVSVGVSALERVLAQGEPSPEVLAQLQHTLEEEDRTPYLLVMSRGERAGSDQLMTWLEQGNASSSTMGALAGSPGSDPGLALLLRLPGELKREHAALLHCLNQMVEAAKLPEAEQTQRLREIEQTVRNQLPLVRLLVPALLKIAEASQRMHAQLRCAIVLLAAERYRQQKNRWPASVQDLVDEGYLTAVPVDPYDGAVIRLKRVPDGLVVYSVGPDRTDDGGHLDRKNFLAKGTDIGFRLWDVARRRQPLLPPKPKETAPEAQPEGGAPGGPPAGQVP